MGRDELAAAGRRHGWPGLALEVFGDEVVAGGNFKFAGGRRAFALSAWDGRDWHPVGGGVQGGGVSDLAIYDGALIACGDFVFAGQGLARGIARWDGVAWRSIGEGLVPPPTSVSRVTAWQGQPRSK